MISSSKDFLPDAAGHEIRLPSLELCEKTGGTRPYQVEYRAVLEQIDSEFNWDILEDPGNLGHPGTSNPMDIGSSVQKIL